MFNVNAKPVFTRTVPIMVPSGDGFDEQSLKVTFRALPPEEVAKFDTYSADGSADLLRAAIVGMDELVDDAKQPVAYTDELRDRLLLTSYVRTALVLCYSKATSAAKRETKMGCAAMGHRTCSSNSRH